MTDKVIYGATLTHTKGAHMTDQLIQELNHTMKNLCTELGISTPTVMANRRRFGCYYPQKQRINLGQKNLKDPAMLKQVFVHELAHHVDHQVNKEDWAPLRRMRTRKSHDRKFYRTLLLVIDKFYALRSDYPWQWEYVTLLNWARYAGLTEARKQSKQDQHLIMAAVHASIMADRYKLTDRIAAERGQS